MFLSNTMQTVLLINHNHCYLRKVFILILFSLHEGQQVNLACLKLNEPIEIECETQHLASKIELFLEPDNPTTYLKNCPVESLENEINRFCKNLSKTDKCKFSVLNFTSGYADCYVSSKNISVSFQCNSKFLFI